ncbi:MAG: hypothetical protein E7596_05395 [Ruminococcaceae bacterium]|nr:hypothetical protein [Oscillospiraceae bacterium]
MQDLKIYFEIEKLPFYTVSHKKGRKTLEIQAFDGIISASVQYDYDRRPLDLSSEIKEGDRVEIILLDYRIELYINGELKDEEWPDGNRLFGLNDEFTPSTSIQVTGFVKDEDEPPSVISSFENAQGWYPGNGVFVGDCMPYVRDNEYHVLYLKDRHHHKSKWGMGAHQWEHISTKDFKTWSIHPMAVPITNKDEGSICTGSWIRKDNKEYLYYTVRRAKGLPALISRSVSEDGYHFEKDKGFGFTVSEKFNGNVARDPKVIRDENGIYHMFLTTVLISENKGCLAHYVSKDLEEWQEAEKPIHIVENSDHPECPDYFKYSGKYYLVFSLRGRARYLVSDKPFEDFASVTDELIPCAGVPKCSEWNGRLVFTGFKPINGYAGTMTFKAARADQDGRLIFEEL